MHYYYYNMIEQLRDYIIGDFLTEKKPKFTITSIKTNVAAMNFIKAKLLPKWHLLPDLLPYFHKLKKRRDAIEILRRALATSAIMSKVLSNNMLAYSILVYLDTKTESSFKKYLKAFFDLSVRKPVDFTKREVM